MTNDHSQARMYESLQALQDTLKAHQDFAWHAPVTDTMDIQRLTPARVQLAQEAGESTQVRQ